MVPMTIAEIAAVTGAEFAPASDTLISEISTDSRVLPKGCLFIALTGDRFDGHTYISQALETGAAFAMAMRTGDWPCDRVLQVKDTRHALLAIAGLCRKKSGVKVVGITGSVGKTTTKEMTACVLESTFSTLKTEENLNNEVGVSHTLLRLANEQAAVVEMGMDAPGQIRPLSIASAPDVAIVTSIGVSHMEAMGSRENILAEKLQICAGMPNGATVILCADDDLLRTVQLGNRNVLFYGLDSPDAPIRAERLNEFSTHTSFEILYNGKRFDAQVPCLGRHNVRNALAAFAAGVTLGVAPQDAVAALKNYTPAGMRQRIVVHNSCTMVEDCYNASPDSMQAALETLGRLPCEGRRIAVLADMLELGTLAETAHYQAGQHAAQNGIDYLLCTGTLATGYVKGAKEAGMKYATHYDTKDALFTALSELLQPGDVVWFKASRGMALENVIGRIYKECSPL